jgi:hypothetical protein
MEGAVFLQEPILQSAVETERGEEPAVHRGDERIRIVGASARRGAKDAAHFLRDLGALDPPPNIERRGVGDGAAEELRVFERQLDRAVASHRQAPDHPSMPLRHCVERAIHEADHIFKKVALIGWAGGRITVKAAAAVRHHDDQRQVGNVALDARTACPGRVVVGETVEEIADRKRRLPDTALGDDHIHRARLREHGTVEVQSSERHGRGPSEKGRCNCLSFAASFCS